MEVISNIEIFLVLAIAGLAYDLYQLYNFSPEHFEQGYTVSSGSCPWPGSKEFPSNYKMVYKAGDTIYKFVSPTKMIFRYNFDPSQIKNLIILKGTGELKDGEIIFSSKFGLISPGVIFLLIFASFFFMKGDANAQDIVGAIIALFLGASYFLYCRSAADKLPISVVEGLAETMKK
ncbi:MAG: hypothetical protein ACJAS4_003318 [Bacteriovoracaceae bacterium]